MSAHTEEPIPEVTPGLTINDLDAAIERANAAIAAVNSPSHEHDTSVACGGASYLSMEQTLAAQGWTPAQITMRREQLSQGHGQPVGLDEAFTQLMGEPSTEHQIAGVALHVIYAGPELRGGFAMWQAVQQMVEAGVRAGMDLAVAKLSSEGAAQSS